ncbi:hypothetical protein PBAL39_25080 [Pedobacter sp. BAL39]|uniref:VOC family protein n=1 Tax=Pedobacter sp. BAL39 TaxID=391596 RepID=UPI000155A10B|nr:VOC family protein [Pedobacter sp. BAL39]EDM36602.1 hypothetical protein PBAL39_25080 [Pedobacter sp. BAL39]
MMQNVDLLIQARKDDAVQDDIILSTDDCIRDYYRLKQQGMLDLKEPAYFDSGVFLEFKDPSGNRFVLIEKRDYKEL